MDLKEKFFSWRENLIEKGELKSTSGRDSCWFKLLEYRKIPSKRKDWMDEITSSIIRSYFTSNETFKKQKNSKVKVVKEEKNDKSLILDAFIRLVSVSNRIPSLQELEKFSSIKLEVIRKSFKSANALMEEASTINPHIKDLVFNEESFTDEYFNEVHAKVKDYDKFVITTAVSGKAVDEDFLSSLKNYAERNNAMILILPCEDAANRNSVYKWELSPALKKCGYVVYRDLYINDNVYISDIKVSAKQIDPLTGLDIFAQSKGTMILASAKQNLKFVPNSNIKLPRALMTTGAVTVPDYKQDAYMSKRISKIAEFNHVLGAVILERESKETFHFRQIQADAYGCIADLGIKYSPNGDAEEMEGTVAILGDCHVGVHNLKVHEQLKEIVTTMNCEKVILHDIFNATSITHHDNGKFAVKAAKANKGLSSLEKEGKLVCSYLKEWSNYTDELVIVKSNHDEALDRYLNEGRWMTDAINFYFSLDLVKKLVEEEDPLKYMIEKVLALKADANIVWLKRDEDYNVYGSECGSHGDLGSNGARGSLAAIEKAYNRAVVGHSHTAGIHRQVYQVGTSSDLKLDYNRGSSSWTQSMALIYPNGSRQLINIVPRKDGSLGWRI